MARARRPNRRRYGKGHAAIVGDVLGELPSGGFHAGAVITLEKIRAHEAARIAGPSVVDDGFETVADFGPVFAFSRSDEKKDAAIFFFAADAELLVEFVAVLLDGFTLERENGNDGHLRAGLLLELGAQIFETLLDVWSDDVGEISDVAGGMNVF